MSRSTQGPGALHRSDTDSGGRLSIILLIFSLVLFTYSARTGNGGIVGGVQGAFQTVATPVRMAGAAISAPFIGLGNIFENLTASHQTLSELKKENEELKARNAELVEAEKSALRLQDLLDLKGTYQLQATAAHVISGSADSWSSTITIDKGTTSGFAVGMPVTDTMGVVGQISQVSATTSVIRLITDENSSVSAMIQKNRVQGMLRGSADGTLQLTLVGIDQDVSVGDMVVTSGLGGVYPKGLPLGTVISVEKPEGSVYYKIIVDPIAHSKTLEEVLVITALTDKQQASADDINAADTQEKSVESDKKDEEKNEQSAQTTNDSNAQTSSEQKAQ